MLAYVHESKGLGKSQALESDVQFHTLQDIQKL